MPTVEEIRGEWKAIRPALGNLINYMDGKTKSLKSLDEAYQKGINDGSLDAKERVSAAFQCDYWQKLTNERGYCSNWREKDG